jgi:hypothetical protein
MWHNVEWLQIDQCIMSWLYTSVTPSLMQMVQVPQLMSYIIWCTIHVMFFNNADQCVIYTLWAFHSLCQGDLSVIDYFSSLKLLADLLRDVGHPVSDPAMVISAMHDLNSKLSHTILPLYSRLPALG